MPKRKASVCWAIKSLSIKSFKRNRKRFLHSFFTPGEIKHLKSRPLQSAAAFLALKRALVQLCKDAGAIKKPREKSFVITHAPDGAPIIKQPEKVIPDALSGVFISITHTRTHAFGLAAIEVKAHG